VTDNNYNSSEDSSQFLSLEQLRAAHSRLLKRSRSEKGIEKIRPEVTAFIQRGKATGATLDDDTDRWSAQNLLDYWTTQFYRLGYEPPDATLDEFDPNLSPILDDFLRPYIGLDAFQEKNESIFFGRNILIEELVEKLKNSRFLAVLGPSGSGKSSLIHAGLLPALKKNALTGSENWIYFTPMVPGSDPLANLGRVILQNNKDISQIQVEASRFQHDPKYLASLVSKYFSGNVVLVVDQFEEIFTLCMDVGTRKCFVDNLIGLCKIPTPQHRVIITMRTDFETNIVRLPSFQRIFEKGIVRVTPLSASELHDAIELPASHIGLKFERNLVDALVNEILGEPAALPLLQFTLLKLWEQREHNRVTWKAYKMLGGGRQTLARSADEFYKGLIPEEQSTMKRILLKLVRPGEGLEVTSSRVPHVDLYQKNEANDRIDRVLDKLIKAHLLRISEGDIAADEQVEIAHEALIRNWPRLVEWLEEERFNLRGRQRLTLAANEWQRLGQAPSALWRGILLTEARRYDDLNALEEKFIIASEAAEQREREQKVANAQRLATAERLRADEQSRFAAKLRRRTNLLTLITILLVVITSIAAVLAVHTYNLSKEARASEAKARASEAQANERAKKEQTRADEASQHELTTFASNLVIHAQRIIETRPMLKEKAVLLAIQSMKIAPSLGAEQILQKYLSVFNVTEISYQKGEPLAAISPDGKFAAAAGRDNSVRIWELSSGNLVASLPNISPISMVTFPANSKFVAAGTSDSILHVWEISSGKEIAHITYDKPVTLAAFSPDGRYVVSSNSDNSEYIIQVKEILSGNEIASMKHDFIVTSVAFSTDGKYVVSGSSDTTIRVWEIPLGKEIYRIPNSYLVSSVAFSPDGKRVAAGSPENIVIVWDVESGDEITRMTPVAPVTSVAFSSDGKYVASGSSDGTARIWDAESGDLIALMPHGGPINFVAFNPDGKYVASISTDNGYDGTIIKWPYQPDFLIDEACSHLSRPNLEKTEWEEYFGDREYTIICPNLPIGY
jgi:WD40 repeat protein